MTQKSDIYAEVRSDQRFAFCIDICFQKKWEVCSLQSFFMVTEIYEVLGQIACVMLQNGDFSTNFAKMRQKTSKFGWKRATSTACENKKKDGELVWLNYLKFQIEIFRQKLSLKK